jgi:hypothetical protein
MEPEGISFLFLKNHHLVQCYQIRATTTSCNISRQMLALIVFSAKTERSYNRVKQDAAPYINLRGISHIIVSFTWPLLYPHTSVALVYLTIHRKCCLICEHHSPYIISIACILDSIQNVNSVFVQP